MTNLRLIPIVYRSKKYYAVEIPDVFMGTEDKILISTRSLCDALYNETYGYADETACYIDEQIYAYVEEDLFQLPMSEFINRLREVLD